MINFAFDSAEPQLSKHPEIGYFFGTKEGFARSTTNEVRHLVLAIKIIVISFELLAGQPQCVTNGLEHGPLIIGAKNPIPF